MTKKLQNKNIVITGGTSGLGRALALQFLDEGANVAVVARNIENLHELQSRYPKIKIIQGDVANKKDIHRIYFQALAHLGTVDILINNASSLGPTPLRPLLDTECEDFEDVIQTNLLGPFRLTKLFLSSMVLQQKGIVINISSDAAVNAYPTWGAYSVSKAAQDHLTRVFAEELRNSGVHFLAVDPGDMNTPMHLAANPDADISKLAKPGDSAALLIKLIQNEKLPFVRGGLR